MIEADINNEDPEAIIEEEKEKTYSMMTKQKTKHKDGFFKETKIKA